MIWHSTFNIQSSVQQTTFFALHGVLIVKHMEKNLDVTKPSYSKYIYPVPWPFVLYLGSSKMGNLKSFSSSL